MLVVVFVYLAAIGYLFLFQRSYVFHPGGTLAEPATLGLAGIEVVALQAEDGTELTGWYAPAPGGRPTLLYFHGNAGNLSGRADRFATVLGSRFGLLAMSYRGYPGSGGSPSQTALFADALSAFDWLAERTSDIVVHGESLGTGVAAFVAAERPAQALILEAPYTAALDIAGEAYPWVPVSLLMRDPFLTREHVRRVEEPVLIVHGTQDRVIPVEHGRRLFEAAGEPKRLLIIEGAAHDDLWERGLWPAVLDFLRANGVAAQAPPVRATPSWAG
jgi:fermentation-respiration switch protein FrsA (DUF1100 family)